MRDHARARRRSTGPRWCALALLLALTLVSGVRPASATGTRARGRAVVEWLARFVGLGAERDSVAGRATTPAAMLDTTIWVAVERRGRLVDLAWHFGGDLDPIVLIRRGHQGAPFDTLWRVAAVGGCVEVRDTLRRAPSTFCADASCRGRRVTYRIDVAGLDPPKLVVRGGEDALVLVSTEAVRGGVLSVFDVQGRTIVRLDVPVVVGRSTVRLPRELPKGVYLASFAANGEVLFHGTVYLK